MRFSIRETQHLNFYPGDCRRQIEGFLAGVRPSPGTETSLVAAVVPHAGWRFSGGVAARTLRTLAERCRARHVILLGAVHRAPIQKSAVYPAGKWETPLGPVEIDSELAEQVLDELADLVEENIAAHDGEHSLEVQLPFVHEFFPGVPVLPILVPPTGSPARLGADLARRLRDRSVAVIASTDLTHYGEVYGFAPAGGGDEALAWMESNDRRILDAAVAMDPEAVLREAQENWNACGAGALAGAVAFAKELGIDKGTVLEHTNSHRVEGRREPFRMGVGYAGLVF